MILSSHYDSMFAFCEVARFRGGLGGGGGGIFLASYLKPKDHIYVLE
jgi:hypothetical protein